jgi:hypothetical protein
MAEGFVRAWTRQLLSLRPDHPNWMSVVLWWEIRRIPYNIVVGLAGAASMIATFFLIIASGTLEPGEDAVEPIAWIGLPLLGAIFFNLCYTAGWCCELVVRATSRQQADGLGSALFFAGLALSLAIVLFPAISWGLYDVVTWLFS